MKPGRNLSLPDLALIRDAIYPQALAIDSCKSLLVPQACPRSVKALNPPPSKRNQDKPSATVLLWTGLFQVFCFL